MGSSPLILCIQATLDQVVADQVLAVPSAACKGLRVMVMKRADEVSELKDEIATLEADCTRR